MKRELLPMSSTQTAIRRVDSNTISYTGPVYMRPCDRGVSLPGTTFGELLNTKKESAYHPIVDDLFYALRCGREFDAEITVRRIPPQKRKWRKYTHKKVENSPIAEGRLPTEWMMNHFGEIDLSDRGDLSISEDELKKKYQHLR